VERGRLQDWADHRLALRGDVGGDWSLTPAEASRIAAIRGKRRHWVDPYGFVNNK